MVTVAVLGAHTATQQCWADLLVVKVELIFIGFRLRTMWACESAACRNVRRTDTSHSTTSWDEMWFSCKW